MSRKFDLDLKRLREEHGLSIFQLADKLNKNVYEIQVLENNGHKINEDELKKTSETFGCSIDELVFGSTKNKLDVEGLTAEQIKLVLKIFKEFKRG
jgi:transcriptional regulator with XRE-family HTH domain